MGRLSGKKRIIYVYKRTGGGPNVEGIRENKEHDGIVMVTKGHEAE